MKLGYNTKNLVIETLVNGDRRKIWKQRLIKIIEDWKDKGLTWEQGNKILEEENEFEFEEEISLIGISLGIIDIINIFNRGKCKEHNCYLGEYHL